MTLESMAKRASEFDDFFERVKDDEGAFDDEAAEVHNMDRATYEAFLAKRSKTEYGRVFAEFRDFVLSTVLDAYVRGDAGERQAIRRMFAERRFALITVWSLLDEYKHRALKAPPQEVPATLRTLLLLAVLAEEYLPAVETSFILSAAWRVTEHHGLAPAQFFREAADLAGEASREVLLEFEPYE